MLGALLGCVLFAVLTVALTEAACFHFVYRHDAYRKVLSLLEKQTAVVKAIRGESVEGTVAASKSAAKKLQRAEEQVEVLTRQVGPWNMRVALLGLAVVLSAYQVLAMFFDGVVVGRLPFEPFEFVRGLTHRGLAGEDWRDCSSHLIFAMTMVTVRALAGPWLEVRGLKPKTPPTPSMWEMAERQADRMQQTRKV